MIHSIKEDKELERKYLPSVKKETTNIFRKIYSSDEVEIIFSSIDNKSDMDKFLSIDLRATSPNQPTYTMQVKGRRIEHYSYFQRNQDTLISLKKCFKSGFKCDGDYIKCNCDYYFYGFLNDRETEFIYWVLLDWSKYKKVLSEYKLGINKIPGVKIIEVESKEKDKTSICAAVPLFYAKKHNCYITDSETFYGRVKPLPILGSKPLPILGSKPFSKRSEQLLLFSE